MKEINDSLKSNLRGGCSFSIQQHDSAPFASNSGAFDVLAVLPSVAMLDRFQSMPMALSKVNEQFPAIAKIRGFDEKYRDVRKASWSHHPHHPNQNHSLCYAAFHAAAAGPTAFFPNLSMQIRAHHVSSIRKAVVYFNGAVGASCGRYLGSDGCGSRFDVHRKCHPRCLAYMQQWHYRWTDLWNISMSLYNKLLAACDCSPPDRRAGSSSSPLNITFAQEVFLATAYWDTNYHHFNVDGLARIAYFLPYLRANPAIKVHVYGVEHFSKLTPLAAAMGVSMRLQLLALLGIASDRLVTQTVFADVVHIPRTMFCAHAAVNPIEIRLLATQLLRGVYAHLDNNRDLIPATLKSTFVRRRELYLDKEQSSNEGASVLLLSSDLFETLLPGDAKVIVVLQRQCPAHRCWTDSVAHEVMMALKQAFPANEVHLLKSQDSKQHHCLACDLFLHSIADILVGEHGAGLTNVMLMKAGSLLVETVANINARSLPMCGYYSALAAGMGVHHYMYAYLDQRYSDQGLGANFSTMAEEAAVFRKRSRS